MSYSLCQLTIVWKGIESQFYLTCWYASCNVATFNVWLFNACFSWFDSKLTLLHLPFFVLQSCFHVFYICRLSMQIVIIQCIVAFFILPVFLIPFDVIASTVPTWIMPAGGAAITLVSYNNLWNHPSALFENESRCSATTETFETEILYICTSARVGHGLGGDITLCCRSEIFWWCSWFSLTQLSGVSRISEKGGPPIFF